jgi:crotonobetainyl-CoA:carnitine CoA-transferase CaiB-like acyl-CoA transferase
LKGPDLVVWAMGLAMAQCGTLDRAPVQVSFPQAFMHAGADGAEGTMVALYHAQITGEGQHVDVAAMESVIWSVVEVIPEWDLLKYNSKRPGSSLVRPSGKHAQIIWECQDGYVCYIINGGQLGAKTNRGLVDWMGQEAMAPLFMKNIDWDRWGWDEITQEELDSIAESVARFFKCHTKGEILDEAVKRNMQIVPIYDSKDTLASTQLRARQFWVDINHAELADNITYPGAFAQFSETPIRIRHRAPLIGEHNEEIYIEKLGMTIEEISTLKSRGVI